MRPRAQNLNLNRFPTRMGFQTIITNTASFVRLQESLPDNEKTSLASVVRSQVIEDSCAWVSSKCTHSQTTTTINTIIITTVLLLFILATICIGWL